MKNNKPSLSVFFHPYAFWSRKVCGVGRYVVELGEALINLGMEVHCPIKESPTDLLLNSSFYPKCSQETPKIPCYLKLICTIGKKTKFKNKISNLKRYWEGSKALKKGQFDIIHPTHNNSVEILKYRKNSALVITVHDMIHELFPQYFTPDNQSIYRKKIMVQQADRIIAISHQTKEDLIRIIGITPDKIDVIYHGNSLHLPADVNTRKLNIPSEYLLFVGHRHGYKNFTTFVKGAARLMQDHPNLHIVCVGGTEFTKTEIELIKSLQITDRITRQCVSDDTLAILYNRAIAFVYPSMYEGFGLPILEAYSCQCPVICAQASCFPEIAGEGCLYFSPESDYELYTLLKRLKESNELRQEYIAKGTERLKFFSWEKCAQETLNCYYKAIETKNNS